MSPTEKGGEPVVELRSIAKRFGSVQANSGLNLSVRAGTIHAVVGENGAGKSTAMKILYGQYKPDEGEILVRGASVHWHSPRDAIAAGIGMVHQHFMLAGPYSVVENVLLGDEGSFVFSRTQARERLSKISRESGFPEMNWDACVEDLPVGIQQRIEILKLLYREAQVLILDEPTAVLTPQETQELFTHLRAMVRDQGKTVIVITHKLQEVMRFSDRVTVMRAGSSVAELETAKTSVDELAQLMVGRKVNLKTGGEEGARSKPQSSQPAVSLAGVSVPGLSRPLRGIDLEVFPGEIVGIAGVEGNGQSELLQFLMHPSEYYKEDGATGSYRYFGEDVSRFHNRDLKKRAFSAIPEDRHHEAILMESNLEENFLLGLHREPRFARSGLWVNRGALAAATRKAIAEHDVRPADPQARCGRLSGGNQQKVVIARELDRGRGAGQGAGDGPRFLIAAQPTRGVDIGAIEAIHRRILDARARGLAVLLVSSELEEVLALSDRIGVMYGGRIAAWFERGKVTEEELGFYMGGGGAS